MARRVQMASIDRRTFLQGAVLGAAGIALMGPPGVARGASSPPVNDDIDAFEGIAAGLSGDILEIDVAGVARRVEVARNASIWRGGVVDLASVRGGDDVLVRTVDGQVENIWANLALVRGIVAGRTPRGYAVQRDKGASTIELAVDPNSTRYIDLMSGRAVAPAAFPAGTVIEASGLSLDGAIVASVVNFGLPGAQPATAVKPGPDEVHAGPLCSTNIYYGVASLFDCGNGAGRCGTCSTSNSSQVAWPQFDSCGCCTPSCCDCSRGCKNQAYVSCGTPIFVWDPCQSVGRSCTTVDCGPCQRCDCYNCSACTCSHSSSNCNITYTGTVVDLTRPTFATFYNPSVRTSFPTSVSVCL